MVQTTLPLGTCLSGRYRIDGVIGIGGFGITYLGYHQDMENFCAIKEFFISGKCLREANGCSVVYQGLSDEQYEKFKSRFFQEAQNLNKLQHPNVVHVLDVFEENGTVYIVMDFIEGKTLQNKITREGPLSYELAVNYIGQIADAVGYCHKRHLLHRDIKPDNIMITPDDRAILIDFGSARGFVNDEVQYHTTILTQGYAPLEQYTGTSKKGNYTDIYSLGGVFYFALTGQKPLDATDRAQQIHMPTPREINPAIPIEAERTILKAMEMNPQDRFQKVSEFMDSLVGTQDYAESANQEALQPRPSQQSINNAKINNRRGLWIFWSLFLVLLSTYIGVCIYEDESYLNISPEEVEIAADGGKKTIDIYSNRRWKVTLGLLSWGSYEKRGDRLILTFDANPQTEERTDYMKVSCLHGKITKRINIKQAGKKPYLTISSSSVSFGSEGGTHHFTISTNEEWETYVATYPWGHLTKSGNSLTLRVDANPNTTSRTDYFKIKSESGITRRVDITQAGKQPYLHLSSQSLSFSSSEETKIIIVDCSTDWSISVQPYSWGHVTKDGNRLLYRVDANNTFSDRTDYIKIKAGNVEKRISVTQERKKTASYLRIEPSSYSFGCSGDAHTFHVYTDGDWRVTTGTASWGHYSTDHSNNTIKIWLDDNCRYTAPSRDDYIIVTAGAKTFKLKFHQS